MSYKQQFLLGIIACCVLGFGATRAGAATLTVDDDHLQCPGAGFSSIQAAVLAASPNDKINVCPGTYHEQVIITKPLTIQGIEVAGQNLATIMPTGVAPNSTSLASGNPIAAIVLVDGTDKVNLSNLTIDGSTNGINGCAPNLIGLYYRNSSGKADGLAVKNVKLTPALFGCQSGLGIFVQSGSGGQSKVDITNSSVHDYQKNGITANEVGTDVTIKGNTVTGVGPTNQIAQNGIQVAFGAKGTIDSNSVINHVYSPCTLASCNDAASANILIDESDSVKVTKNNAGNAQVNVYYIGNKGEISNNTLFQNLVFDGIDLIGNQNKAINNSIFNSEGSGIFVMGDKNDANSNTINEAPVGILSDVSSTNSHFGGNLFFNTGTNFGTYPPAAALLRVSGPASGKSPSTAKP
ncbi:MAG: hypothetical protein QOK48_1962 [Blastocatellia bacterium]|nr:hypothetical protein [Blastocatellia bacterium]